MLLGELVVYFRDGRGGWRRGRLRNHGGRRSRGFGRHHGDRRRRRHGGFIIGLGDTRGFDGFRRRGGDFDLRSGRRLSADRGDLAGFRHG